MNSKYLSWIDIETTGLNPKTDVIIEIAVVITTADTSLTLVDELRLSITQPSSVLESMNEWCSNQHISSGLVYTVDGIRAVLGGYKLTYVEQQFIDFTNSFLCEYKVKSHMCGSSVHFDRAFLKEHMPQLESCFHHRNLDVSTVKKFMDMAGYKSTNNTVDCTHRALQDIKVSIQYLRDHFTRLYEGYNDK